MATKAAANALAELQEKFPDLRAGITNCRKIAGSSTWSQHARSNALDIHHKDYGYSTNTNHQKWLDEVAAFVRLYADQLSVRVYLWRVKNHYNHIHIDFWPKAYQTPPCAGGRDDFQYSSGKIVVGDPGPENGYIELPDDKPKPPEPPPAKGYAVNVHRDTIKEGARGDLAQICQSLLARHGFAPLNTFNDNHQPDGIFGGGTDKAVREFQTFASLTVDGIVGPKTWASLEAV